MHHVFFYIYEMHGENNIKYGNAHLLTIKCGEFFDQLMKY
jgi:hypothetical protein